MISNEKRKMHKSILTVLFTLSLGLSVFTFNTLPADAANISVIKSFETTYHGFGDGSKANYKYVKINYWSKYTRSQKVKRISPLATMYYVKTRTTYTYHSDNGNTY